MSSIARIKPGFHVHGTAPFNAEPPPERLVAAFVTAQRDLYVRSHGDIPRIDDAAHRLRVGGLVGRSLELSMAALRERFAPRTVSAVLQCAGNRRADMAAVRPVSGDPWGVGAIGHAAWTGAPLVEILRAAGVDADADGEGRHVSFIACDDCDTADGRERYSVSIPLSKALAPDVLLAWAINGEPLAAEHGAPLRAVVPGYAGVRSAKWLAAIEVRDGPADSHFQARDYKLFPPDVTEQTADWPCGMTIDEMPLNAAICAPADGERLAGGETLVRGWAAVTGRAIARVEVSSDGGGSWRQATLHQAPDAPWSWTLWQVRLELTRGDHELAVRAWDAAGQTQPARPDDVWNFKGYLSAAWHRVRVSVH